MAPMLYALSSGSLGEGQVVRMTSDGTITNVFMFLFASGPGDIIVHPDRAPWIHGVRSVLGRLRPQR